jgi:hypothetical protein
MKLGYPKWPLLRGHKPRNHAMLPTAISHWFHIVVRLRAFSCSRSARYTFARVTRKFLLILSAFFALAAVPSFGTEITTRDGTTYHNAKVTAVDVDGIHVMHSTGVAKLRFEDLPDALQKQYHYDPAKVAAYRKQVQDAEKAAAAQTAAAQEQREQEGAKAQESARRKAVGKERADDTEFLAMRGIAKRVQELLTSEAPITQSTVMVPGKPASDGYQIVILSSKPFVAPVGDSIPASKDPRKAWMIVAAGAAAAYTTDSPLPIKAIAFGDTETLKEKVYYTLDMAIARDMQQKLKSDSIDTNTAYSLIKAGLTKSRISDGSR